MRVGIIAGLEMDLAVGPVSRPEFALRVLVLSAFKPFDIRSHPEAIFFRLRRRVDHRLQADGIRAIEPLGTRVAQIRQSPLDHGRINFFTGCQQGQRGEACRSGRGHRRHLGPRAIGALNGLEKSHAAANRSLDFFTGHVGVCRLSSKPIGHSRKQNEAHRGPQFGSRGTEHRWMVTP